MTDNGHRQFFLVQGEAKACRAQALRLLGSAKAIWISQEKMPGQNVHSMREVNQLLGQEYASLVFDAHAGFNSDAFGAACGLVSGGGAFVLLTPPLREWAERHDPEAERRAVQGYESGSSRFIARLADKVQHGTAPRIIDADEKIAQPLSVVPWHCPESTEQEQAVAAVLRVATGHRRRPLVLTADRGRGKSAAFGIAAAQLLKQGKQKILITAPRMDAAKNLFKHANELLPGANYRRGLVESGEQRIQFVAPDELILNPQAADLLLVDEAAGIPIHLLQALLKRYSRIAFATTVHGYEGSGRGFAVRFGKVLDQTSSKWHSLKLKQPMRWREGDPLESFSFRALLMDAEPAEAESVVEAVPEYLQLQQLDRDKLLTDEHLLTQLFGLLVMAHYRTTPEDLRQLLDGPNVSVWTARHQGKVVAAILAAEEGDFDPVLAEAVWLGRRRPHGHLLPEMLAAHVGIKQAPCLKFMRVIRIAVHPAMQGKGIGTAMMNQLASVVGKTDTDVLGVSYAATAQLVRYWRRTGFSSARLGLTRDASSGAHSVLMLQGLSEAGQVLETETSDKFCAQFPVQLSEPLSDLEPGIAIALLVKQSLDSTNRFEALQTFAHGTRNYGDCLLPLSQLVLQLAGTGFSQISENDACLLVTKILQRRSWKYTAELYGLSGRKQVTQRLREIVRTCLA